MLAYTVERIRGKVNASEFTAVTDVHLLAANERHQFLRVTRAWKPCRSKGWRCGRRRSGR